MAKASGLTSCLKHRDYRFFIGAFTFAGIGRWAYNVALTVWVFQETGSVGWLTAMTVARLLPSLLVSTYAGVVADRFEKVRVMRFSDVGCALVMVALAALMIVGAPVAVVIGVAAVSTILGTLYEPAAAGMTPLLVPERDLASANALRNVLDDTTVIVGPALGAVMLLAGPPQVAILLNGATLLVSAALVSASRTRSTPVDVTEGGSAGPVQQMMVGFRAIGSSATTAVLVGFSALATFSFGVDTVLFVSLSDDVLGTGPDGFGYLLAGMGLGGILAAPLVTRAEALPRLAPVIVGGMAFYLLPTLVFLITSSPEVGFAAQVVRGAGTLFVDVLAITSLQRALPSHVISRVFGAFDVLMTSVVLLGSALATLLITSAGLDTAVWVAGAGLFGVSLLGTPWLLTLDRVARARRAELAPRIALLAACDLFEQVDDGDLTQLAGAAEELALGSGDVVVAEGGPADAFYILVDGTLHVTSSTAADIPDLVAGDHLGEIGLIERVRRTATVTAGTDVRLLRFPGDAFLEALTAHKPSVAFMEGAAQRLRRTHPTLQLQRAGITPEGDA